MNRNLRRSWMVFAFGLLSIGVGARADTDRLGTAGIGVNDLSVSQKFYADVLGLVPLRTFELGYLNEVVMGFPGDSAGDGAARCGARSVLFSIFTGLCREVS